MLKGIYNAIKNGHAFNVIKKNPEVQGLSLCTGNSEIKSSLDGTVLNRIVLEGKKPKQRENKTLDDTVYVGNGKQVSLKDFPKAYYIGEDDSFGT